MKPQQQESMRSDKGTVKGNRDSTKSDNSKNNADVDYNTPTQKSHHQINNNGLNDTPLIEGFNGMDLYRDGIGDRVGEGIPFNHIYALSFKKY